MELSRSDNAILWRYCKLAASRFKAVDTGHKMNFKCNVCGDGKRKKRGYLVFDEERNLVYYKCFNEGDCPCAGDGKAWHGSRWLKFTDKTMYQEFRRETFGNKIAAARGKKKPDENETISVCSSMFKDNSQTEIEKEFKSFSPIKNCPDSLKAAVKDFCIARKIPKERVKEFRVALVGKYRNRLAIPSFGKDGKLVYFQCRALLGQTPKYLNSSSSKTGVVYGEERIKENLPVIVLEGPIDSMFVENGVATFGCSYPPETQRKLDCLQCLYLMDNDRAGNSKSRELLNSGRRVFDWDKFLRANGVTEKVKDINDFIKAKNKDFLTVAELKPFFTNSIFDMVRFTK